MTTWADFVDRVVIRFPFKVISIDHPPPIAQVENPARYLRNMVLRALAHELDETFLVDDIKLHDPHRQECYVPPRLLT